MITTIGTHRLLCGDLTAGAVAQLMGEERADLIYSDPPWGPGNQRYWHTHNGTVPRTSWDAFLAAFCAACAAHRKPRAPVFVEMGLHWLADLDVAMAAVGLPLRRRWDTTYGPKSAPLPNGLSLYGPRDVPVNLGGDTHGPPVTRAVLQAVLVRPRMVVLDPCTGKGMTARNTHLLGGRFRGCELNPRRLAVTEAWLRRRT